MKMIRNPEANCKNCPYGGAVCSRYPPVSTVTGGGGYTSINVYIRQPEVRKNDSCGEHPEFLIEEKIYED